MDESQKIFLFNLIGAFSTAALVMIVFYVLPGAIHGDFSVIGRFFNAYPGSQPFVIYAFPVVLILGGAWTWRVLTRLFSKPPR
jgi:hypothetical protein